MNRVHIAEQALAGLALGEQDALGADDRRHLGWCRTCQAELAELQTITQVARDTEPVPIHLPGPHLLGRINDELAFDPEGRATPDVDSTRPPDPRGVTGPRRRLRPRPLVLLAAALGLVLGAGGTIAYERLSQPEDEIVAATRLDPLPGQTGGGRAELVRVDGVETLRVQVDATTPDRDFHELWLINTDGRRMISLGVLAPSGRGSYPLPSQLSAGLQDYTVVDVSLEPYDGNAAHSLKSVVRGSLS